MGFVQVELSTNGVTNEKLAYDEVTDDQGVNKNILRRMKSCIKACAENGGLFIWQDMEYIYHKKANYVNQILKDRELYDLLKINSENIIIMDKHNGHGRHFASQANIIGCWLDDVCGNWGVNLENFLWYEEGFTEYDDIGLKPNEPDFAYTAKYPPALYGIDMIADLVGGATVYALEGTFSRGGLYHFVPCDGLNTAYGVAEMGEEPQMKLVLDDWGSKLWWVHSEAAYTNLLMHLQTGEEVYLRWFERVFDYTWSTFPNPDPTLREWIQIRTREGLPQEKVVALPVKDPYHIMRNVLLIIELLEKKL